MGYVEDCLKGGNLIEEVGLHPNTAGERGLKLLVVGSFQWLYFDVQYFKIEAVVLITLFEFPDVILCVPISFSS